MPNVFEEIVDLIRPEIFRVFVSGTIADSNGGGIGHFRRSRRNLVLPA
jgi:hypothetical protein